MKTIRDKAEIFASMIYDGLNVNEAGPFVYGEDQWDSHKEDLINALPSRLRYYVKRHHG